MRSIMRQNPRTPTNITTENLLSQKALANNLTSLIPFPAIH